MTDDSLRDALRRLPAALNRFDETGVAAARPLAGLSNRSYRLTATDGRRYVLRLPPRGRRDIDREQELRAHATAAALGLCPALRFAAVDGPQLSVYIEPGTPLDAAALRGVDAGRALRLLRRLHHSGRRWPLRRDLLTQIDVYLRRCDPVWRLRLSPLRARLRRRAVRLRPRAGALRPCHIDPSPANFIRAAGRLYLIDWEYAAMSDPLWDLAALAIEADADAATARRLLRRYRRGERADPRLTQRYRCYLVGLALISASWAAVSGDGRPSVVDRGFIIRRLRQARRYSRG